MHQDLRYVLRVIAKTPGFSLLIVFALALGIGANTAIFTAANDFLFRPLPFPDAGRLVTVTEIAKVKQVSGWTSPRDYMDWHTRNHVFSGTAAWGPRGVNLTGGGEAERVPGMGVTASFFPLLGVKPLLGRAFVASEDMPKGDPVVVLSYSLWQRRFGGRSDILGQTVTMDGKPYTVIGVMPPGFWFSNAHEEIFSPIGLNPASTYRGSKYLKVIARLKPGMSLERAQAEISELAAAIGATDPEHAGQGVAVERLQDRLAREVRPALVALLAAVGLVLLIACANVANMLLARAAARTREIAIRRAVGAAGLRIVRQVLTEALLLSGSGAVLGLAFAVSGVRLLYRAIPAALQPFQAGGVDATVLAFTALVAVATGLLFGAAPAFAAARPDLVEALKDGARTSPRAGRRLRAWLVISEVALSVVLLAGAGVLIKSFMRLSAVDPGFRSEGVLAVRIQRQDNQERFASAVLDRAAALPGVVAVGAVSNLPMTGLEWGQNLTVTDRPFRGEQDYIWACHRVATRDYFHVVGMRLMKGCSFTPADTRDRPSVAVVNEAFARKAWPGQDAVGKQFRIGDFPKYAGPPVTVIGVVADAKFVGPGDESFPEMFFSLEQRGASNGMTFVLRAAQDPQSLAGAVRSVIHAVDRNQPVTRIETLEQLVAASTAPQRLTMLLGGIFGLLALVLAGTGLYGTLSYSVSQRTHEIGIRMALGAPQGRVIRQVLREALQLTLVGLAAGLVAAITFGRVLSALLFQVSPHDPFVLIGVSMVFVIIALAAGYAPARRAAKTDPLSALRCS